MWLCIALMAPVAGAQDPATGRCAWGRVTDVEAVRTLLREWAVETGLPPFGGDKWDVSIDRSSVWIRLQFAKGDLGIAWDLDDNCEPTGIAIRPSSTYEGAHPDKDAVRLLVARFRSVTVEKRPQTSSRTYSALPRLTARTSLGVLVALGALLTWLVLRFWRRWRARGQPLSDIIRLLGLLAIVALLPSRFFPPVESAAGNRLYLTLLVLGGILPLMAFLWLALTGAFGYGSPRRQDWPALFVFLLALAIREGYARHAIQELEIYFYYGAFPSRHSVVRMLFQMFLQSLAADQYRFMMHVNGVLGSLATLPLFLFVRQRAHSRMAAALVATFYAVHPILAQMAPTDGPSGFMLSMWFAGLVLLTADEIGPRQLFGGAILLGLAATSRAEGSLYLLASLLLIDVRVLLAAACRHVSAAFVSTCAVLGLIAVHVYYCFPAHLPAGESLPSIGTVTLTGVLRAGLFSVDFNDRIIVALVGVGALAGLVNKRLRIGLGAALGTLVVVWPVSMATTQGFTVLHRLVPVCALQVIAAGVGAAWITSWLPARVRHHWAAAIPAVILALFVFANHRDEVREPNAVTEEFWMLRNHLAPGGVVNPDCALLFVGRPMDTDIHNFRQVLPAMEMIHCEEVDCVDRVSRGGCFYYLRNLNCFYDEVLTPPECFENGRTPAGDVFACIDPRCAQLERVLELSPVEERTVDLYAAFRGNPRFPRWPRNVNIALYKVQGIRESATAPVPP